MSVLADPAWRPLFDVLADLLRTDPSALPPAAVTAATQPGTWTATTAYRVSRLLTGPARASVQHLGVDPDLLPVPEPPLRIDTSAEEGTVRVVAANGVLPAEARTALSGLPRAVILPGQAVLPATPAAADALRALLEQVPAHVTPDAAARLRNPGPAPSSPSGLSLTAKGRVVIQHQPGSDFATAVSRVAGVQWSAKDGCWYAPPSSVTAAVRLCDQYNVPVADAARDAVEARTRPFDYDGTLDGLRGVPLTELASVAPQTVERFAGMGIHSVFDLLLKVPRRYLDRSRLTPIADAQVGVEAALVGHITRVNVDGARRVTRFDVSDGSGSLTVTFFNMPWQAKRFRVGDEVVLLGQVDEWAGHTRRVKQMTNPVMDPLGEDTLPVIPVYGQSAKSRVTTWDISTATREAIARLGTLVDPVPDSIVRDQRLIARQEAFAAVHFPESLAQVAPARTRLAFDELFRMQAALLMAKHGHADLPGFAHDPHGPLTTSLVDALPFPLTGAQQRAWATIATDLSHAQPMHRLLQGDVGSGKTLVAALTLLAAVQSGRQAALMAPTEILANQLHDELLTRLEQITRVDGSPLRLALLTNRVRGKRRDALLAELASGDIDIVVGTHALLVDDVRFASLSVVVVDEQHRFGVEQRAQLRDKTTDGITPDMLVMTATPIPRTAAMTVFGDLEVSILDEMPPGRTPIVTHWLDDEPDLHGLGLRPWDVVRAEVARGRQAYVVCPLVTDSEKLQAANATETHAALANGALAGLRVGLVHGQQKAEERTETMTRFVAGDLDVLVATTVIEVGVNVPNATVMVVLDSGRFGIAQLHQLRGRVGRGNHPSQCFLVGRVRTPDGRARMQALCESTDGFYLSEVDLQLRGHGSILGTEQSGVSDLRVADLESDMPLLEAAREQATRLMDGDPMLQRRPLLRSEIVATLGSEAMTWLARS